MRDNHVSDNYMSMIEKMIIERNKVVDGTILGEIQKIAVENGIKTKIILYEKAIVNALKKAIPKPPKEDGWLYCPVCGKDICIDKPNYCSACDQRIDWSEER